MHAGEGARARSHVGLVSTGCLVAFLVVCWSYCNCVVVVCLFADISWPILYSTVRLYSLFNWVIRFIKLNFACIPEPYHVSRLMALFGKSLMFWFDLTFAVHRLPTKHEHRFQRLVVADRVLGWRASFRLDYLSAFTFQLSSDNVCSCLTVDTSWLHSDRGWLLGARKASPFANVSSLLRYASQGRRVEEGISSSDVFNSTLESSSFLQKGRYAETN